VNHAEKAYRLWRSPSLSSRDRELKATASSATTAAHQRRHEDSRSDTAPVTTPSAERQGRESIPLARGHPPVIFVPAPSASGAYEPGTAAIPAAPAATTAAAAAAAGAEAAAAAATTPSQPHFLQGTS
jgi:hypothetical protein